MVSPSYRLGVDVGGTFTDLLLLREDTGEFWRAKVPSTPQDQSIGVIEGKTQILSKIPDGANVVLHVVNHGTTIATNTILEQKGAKVALVVTEGFKDILQTRRAEVPGGLGGWIVWPKPEPLAPLELTTEAPGRLATDGSEVRVFDEVLFRERFARIVDLKPDSVTISLINSFTNPKHERQARSIVSSMLPDVPVSISSEVLPELMEYERTITTVVNSYVEPRVSRYLDHLLASVEGKTKHLRILRSDGGLSSVSLARRFPVSWVLSGPAGGVTGVVSQVAERTEYKNLITVDMGGTSTDVALIERGTPRLRRETKVGDLIVKTPSIDVRTVGAGGGSMAKVPEVTKALRVGPESAGAVPGPACYNKGGSIATVTDANAVLGYLPKSLLGGDFALDIDAAKDAVQRTAEDLGVGLYEAAEGILKISNETMYGALRLVSVEQGYDPREFSLVAFGGAGPAHANSLGILTGAFPVIIPPSPGVLCAFGDATTLLRHEIGRPFFRILQNATASEVTIVYNKMREEITALMTQEQGVPVESQRHAFLADLRYSGQNLTVTVDVNEEASKTIDLSSLRSAFEAEHEKLFTYRLSSDVELVNLRMVAEEIKLDLPMNTLDGAKSSDPPTSLITARTTLVFEGREFANCPIWNRAGLEHGHIVNGPCIVTEMDSNTVVRPGFIVEVDSVGNLLIWPVENNHRVDAKPVIKEADIVTIDIFEAALQNARNEMDALMTRTTMSPAIREQQDEFNVIAEPHGNMLVGQFGSFIPQFLDIWKGSIEAGDIFLTNDAYSVFGAISHQPDILILMPIFTDEKLIAWTANFGHMTDVGGSVPGSLPCAASSVFEEGVQVPITKVASKGVWNTDMMDMIYRNVRLPEWVRSDVQALVASCTTAGKRMKELYGRFGAKVYFEVIASLLDRNRKAMSSIIQSSISDQPVYFEDWIDDDGQGNGPWKLACTLQRKDDKMHFDFTGTDPQSPSSINYYLSPAMLRIFAEYILLKIYDPNVVPNDGCQDLIEVHLPKGSMIQPIRPAALSCRTHFLSRLFDVLSGLFGQRTPDFMTAAGFSDSPHFMYSGYRENGTWFQLYWLGFGGIPGRPIGDGPDGHSLWPAFKSIPNEFLELYYPLRIEIFDTMPDSGGPGLHRGGNGQRMFWRFLEEGEISCHDDRWLSKPWGVLGGEPGARSRKVLVKYSEKAENPPREVLQSKIDHVKVHKNDVLEWITWGGGGWGDPLKRDPDLVALEVARRLVTLEGAKRYGVVVSSDHSVDAERTANLREKMTSLRQRRELESEEQQLINRGGTWEELKAKCLEDTGLPPPKPPSELEFRGPVTQMPWFKKWKESN